MKQVTAYIKFYLPDDEDELKWIGVNIIDTIQATARIRHQNSKSRRDWETLNKICSDKFRKELVTDVEKTQRIHEALSIIEWGVEYDPTK